jgi:DNA primase
MSWEDVKEKIKEQADIVQVIGEYVELKRSGVRYLGLCPFHAEKTPSFSVNQADQYYYCFGCQAAGDVFSFIMNYHRIEFNEALKLLADKYHITIPEKKETAKQQAERQRRERLFQLNEKTAALYRDYFIKQKGAEAARTYVSERGITSKTGAAFELGFAPDPAREGWNFLQSRLTSDEAQLAAETGLLAAKEKGRTYDRFRNRIIFPIRDSRGRCRGFGGRALDERGPKYLNSPESVIYRKGELLYGLYQQKDLIRRARRAVFVEGNFDLLSLVNHGFEGVVAPLGTALTSFQLGLVKPLVDEVILLFDGDQAGIAAAQRAVVHFLAEQLTGRIALLPAGEDPDTFVRAHGVGALHELIAAAHPLPEFVADQLKKRHGLSLDGKRKILAEIKPLIEAAAGRAQRAMIVSHFAGLLGVSADDIRVQAKTAPAPDRREHAAAISVQPAAGTTLTPVARRLLVHMLMHPHNVAALKEAGAQDELAGGIGEVILLQLESMIGHGHPTVQPEEVLHALPPGAERTVVAQLLSQRPMMGDDESGSLRGAVECAELIDWLKKSRLQKQAGALLVQIEQAQKEEDFVVLRDLIARKMEVDNLLKGLVSRR